MALWLCLPFSRQAWQGPSRKKDSFAVPGAGLQGARLLRSRERMRQSQWTSVTLSPGALGGMLSVWAAQRAVVCTRHHEMKQAIRWSQ